MFSAQPLSRVAVVVYASSTFFPAHISPSATSFQSLSIWCLINHILYGSVSSAECIFSVTMMCDWRVWVSWESSHSLHRLFECCLVLYGEQCSEQNLCFHIRLTFTLCDSILTFFRMLTGRNL